MGVSANKLEEVCDRFSVICDKLIVAGTEEVKPFDIILQEDPSTSLSLLQKNIATVQGFLSQVSRRQNELMDVLDKFTKLKSRANELLGEARRALLLQDSVAKMRPKVAQEAYVDTYTSAERGVVEKVRLLGERLKSYDKKLTSRENFVRRSMTNLAMQVGVVKGQVAIGEHRVRQDEGPQRF